MQLAAVGNTLPVALDGAFKFSQLGITAVAETIWEAQTAHAFNLGPEDVVLIISNSGTSSRLQILAEGARENDATVILITNNPESPLAQMADYRIITATREKLFTEEFWFSRVAATAVMEMLYLLLMAGMRMRPVMCAVMKKPSLRISRWKNGKNNIGILYKKKGGIPVWGGHLFVLNAENYHEKKFHTKHY